MPKDRMATWAVKALTDASWSKIIGRNGVFYIDRVEAECRQGTAYYGSRPDWAALYAGSHKTPRIRGGFILTGQAMDSLCQQWLEHRGIRADAKETSAEFQALERAMDHAEQIISDSTTRIYQLIHERDAKEQEIRNLREHIKNKEEGAEWYERRSEDGEV